VFRRLRTRIVVFSVALLGVVQLAAFVLVNASNTTNANRKIESELQTGERVFARLLEQNRERLVQAARVLSADFAFREAIATNDVETVLSALSNHGARIDADTMMLVSLDGKVVADTLQASASGKPFAFPALLDEARQNRTGSSIALLGGRAYQLVVVPVLAPVPIAWVALGFVIDDEWASDLRRLTALDVSFMQGGQGALSLLASTLDRSRTDALIAQLHSVPHDIATTRIGAGSDEQQIKIIPVQQHGSEEIIAILQRSVAEATAEFNNLQKTLMGLGIASLTISLLGSAWIALNLTRPLSRLTEAASRIQGGDYTTPVAVRRKDEIGVLAGSLDQMREGISVREQEILRLAYEDSLTGLPNRALFNKWLTEAIESAGKKGTPIGVLVMDLDRFKAINDALGHGAGDHVLREVAFRLSQLATSDGIVARLGGDEFGILMHHSDAIRAQEIAAEVADALEAPIAYHDQWLDVGASIGIAIYPQHGADASTLLRHSDIAMYVAKRNKTTSAIFDSQYDTHQQQHLSLLGELRRAVELNELQLYYQPKVAVATDEANAVEALLRWVHPVRGFISPGDFIPFAEHTGYIKVLTQWVLQEAVRQCGVWIRQGMPMRISVNISARDLLDRNLPRTLTDLLQSHGVPAELLCIEITESGFMEDPAHARRVLQQLNDIGLRLSIDDYGTGYSSLSYVAQLPVHELKIDRSFVSNLATDAVTATIVKSTIELGHNLGLSVVAEGVEDAAGLKLLKDLGCDQAQGYFFSKPLSVPQLEEWLVRTGRMAGKPNQPAMSTQVA